MSRRIVLLKKGLIYTLYTFAALALMVFCLLFTIPGNQGIAWSINQFSNSLKVEHLKARFYDGEPFDFRYQSNGTSVQLQGVQLKLKPHSLMVWTSAITVEQISVSLLKANEAVQTSIAPPIKVEKGSAQSPQASTFTLNFEIAVNRISYQDSQNDVDLEGLFTRGILNDSVSLDTLSVDSIAVTMSEAHKTAAAQDKTIPALTFPDKFPVPIPLQVAGINVGHIDIVYGTNEQKQQLVIERVSSKATITEQQIQIESFELSAFQRDFAFNGLITQQEANANATIRGPDERFSVNVNGRWSALKVQAENQGKLPFNVNAEVDLLTKNLPFWLDVKLANWRELPFIENTDVANISVGATLEGDVQSYRGHLQAEADVEQLGHTRLETQYQGSLDGVTLSDLALDTPIGKTAGSLNVQFNSMVAVEGTLQWLDVQLARFIEIPTKLAGKTKLSVRQQGAGWQLHLDDFITGGSVAELPLTFNMDALIDEQLYITLDTFLLTLDDSTIEMQGTLTDKLDFNGQWFFDLDQLGDTKLKAKGVGQFSLQGTRAKPKVDLETRFDTFQFRDLAIHALQTKIKWGLTKSSEVLLALNAANATVNHHQLSDIKLSLVGPIDNHRVVAGLSHNEGKLELELQGGFQNEQWKGRVLKTKALFDNREFRQTQATALQVSQTGSVKLSPYCLAWDESQLCLEASFAEQQNALTAKADISEFNVALLNKLLPPTLQIFGHASGQVKVTASETGVEALTANIVQKESALLVMQNGVSYPLVLGKLSFDAKAKGSKFEVGLSNDNSPLGHFSGTITTTLGLENPVLASEFELLNMDLGYLDPLLTQVLNREFQFRGAINGKLATSGTIQNPNIFGNLTISDLAAQNERSPLVLTNSNLSVTMKGKSLSLLGQLNDAQAGMLELSGNASWQNELALDFNIHGKSFWLKPQDGIELKLDTDMKVIWSEGEAKLLGQVSVPYGRIAIKDLPEDAVAISDDQIFVDEAEAEQESLPVKYLVNVKVNVLDDVKIDSFGLKSYLTGNLLLNKQNDTPIVGSGELSLLHGTFKAFGQDLIISKGQIGFSGALDKPYLHVNAIRNPENTANGVVAGVQLTGLAKAPKVALYSEPAMDQVQVLSYLLNGQPLTGGGETDKNVLLTNLLLSQSLNRGEGVLQKVGGGLGLQDVNVGTKGSGEGTQVEVSGFLTPSVQVKYSVGVFDSLSEIAIRYQILSKLYVEITSGLYDSIDLLYRFDWGETEEEINP